MELLVLLLTGGIAGWVAGTLLRGAGFGVVINIIVGVIGGIVGGKLFALAGVGPEGWLMELAAAVVGAILLLGLVNLLRRAPPAD